MPAKTPAQFRAMQAAAHGNSTLGIPKSVGKEFVSATDSMMSQHTGMPTGKKIRRGRHAKKGGSAVDGEERTESVKGPAEEHQEALKRHLAAGNHDKAGTAALHLAKALKKMASKNSMPGMNT